MRVYNKSVRKFAENIVLRLSSSRTSSCSKITPAGRAQQRKKSSGYAAEQFRDQTRKGDLLMPDSVSVYIRRYLSWVKSMYEKENRKEKAGRSRRQNSKYRATFLI